MLINNKNSNSLPHSPFGFMLYNIIISFMKSVSILVRDYGQKRQLHIKKLSRFTKPHFHLNIFSKCIPAKKTHPVPLNFFKKETHSVAEIKIFYSLVIEC